MIVVERKSKEDITMTKLEAMKYFGLSENDVINTDGIKYLLQAEERQLKIFANVPSKVKEIRMKIEAYKALL